MTIDILKNFKVLLLDTDGVWFSGEESRGVLASGEIIISKTRHLQDGQGLSFLRGLGITIGFVSASVEPLASIVSKLNTLPSAISGEWKPVVCVGGKDVQTISAWLSETGASWNECVYFGDDRDDLESMHKVALRVCPANARRVVQAIADLNLRSEGGKGALREFAEMVLDARGIDEALVSAS